MTLLNETGQLMAKELDPTKVSVHVTMQGLAGYRLNKYAEDRDIPISVAAKEIMIEGMKKLDLLYMTYSLNDMRQGK